MSRKIIDEKPIPLGEVHRLLTIREEAGINYVQRVTSDHAAKLSKGAGFAEEVVQQIQESFDLTRMTIVQILNLNPGTAKDIKVITGSKLSDDEVDKLLELYAELRDKFKPDEEIIKEDEEFEFTDEDFGDFDDIDDF